LNPTETRGSDPADSPDGGAGRGKRMAPADVQALYAAYGSELLLFLVGVLRNREAAEEALQNTFQRVLEQGHTARSESLKGWLFKVSFHEAMVLKRRQASQDRVLRKFGDREVRPTGSQVAGEQDLRLIRDEDVARLKRALTQLPAEQRQVVERRVYKEQTFASIAQDLKLPLGTVLTRMRLALEKLQRQLREPSDDRP